MKKTNPTILAIESSCDEMAASVFCGNQIRSSIVATQHIHKKHGGVVPELASRMHQQKVVDVVDKALVKAEVTKNTLDAVAFTQGPGLLGPLLVGNCFAKSLAYGLDLPLIGINHIRAHVLANFIENTPSFPFICLSASGGHTQLILVNDFFDMTIMGETQDDAVGEAFDKIGKMLGLEYPAGVLIDKNSQNGDPKRFKFPSTVMPGLDFSFSGIKTAFMNFLKKHQTTDPDFAINNMSDICASIQYTLVEMLMIKLKKAISSTGVSNVALAGGVAANSYLRQQLNLLSQNQNLQIFIPSLQYCTDNAAMIAITAYYQYIADVGLCNFDACPQPRMSLKIQTAILEGWDSVKK